MLGETHAFLCHPVEVRRFDLGLSIGPQFTISQVVCVDVDDVGLGGLGEKFSVVKQGNDGKENQDGIERP